MDYPSAVAVTLALAYAIGSIPCGYLIARFVRGIDIREHGSQNIGATNVGRVLGPRWGMVALAFDYLKGLLPAWLLPPALVPGADVDYAHPVAVACGIATILGHMYPLWLRFRGGKGVATALGVVTCLSPWSTLVAFLTFVISFAILRIVSLSSILAVTAFAICQMVRVFPEPFSETQWALSAFSLAVPVLIIFRHRSNIGRLWRGEESRYTVGRGQEPKPPEGAV